jgi:hypothetical protein
MTLAILHQPLRHRQKELTDACVFILFLKTSNLQPPMVAIKEKV